MENMIVKGFTNTESGKKNINIKHLFFFKLFYYTTIRLMENFEFC